MNESHVASRYGFILNRLLDPRCLSFLLLLTLIGSLGYQAWQSPRRHFVAGMTGVRDNRRVDVEQAVRSLEGSVAYDLPRAYLKGWLQLQSGQTEDALQLAVSAQDHPDVEVESRVLAGQAAYRLGAAGNAKLFWEEALARDPDCLAAHQWLGVLYYDVGAMDNAMLHLRAVSRLASQDYRPDRFMGLINRDYERPDVAIPHYLESLRRAPNQPGVETVWLELAECQIKQREYDAAMKSLSQCGESTRKKRLTARCLMNIGELDDARRLATQSLLEMPEDVDAIQLNAEIALIDGEVDAAAQLLETAIRFHPFNHGVRTQLAQVLGRLGREAESKEQSARAEELQKLWQRFSDLQIEAINRATDAPIRYEIGLLAKQLGRPELAVIWLKAALAIDPGMSLAGEALAAMEKTPASASLPRESPAVPVLTPSD
jgi:tetratricopeptide (TPR) repeat protein